MTHREGEFVAWVGANIIPHEGDLRRWLRKRLPASGVDDVVQEAYCRIAALEGAAHILNGRAYFFRVAGNIVLEQARRARTAAMDMAVDPDLEDFPDEGPSPERVVSARRDLEQVRALIADLPDRCRRVFVLRRVEGLPQKEVAARLGVTENVVEQQSIRGLRLILAALSRTDEAQGAGGRHGRG
ncbi:putative RNA polymerase sigma factor FecI [compost metagenome]